MEVCEKNILLSDSLTDVFKWICSVFNYSTLFLICISSNDTVPAFMFLLKLDRKAGCLQK